MAQIPSDQTPSVLDPPAFEPGTCLGDGHTAATNTSDNSNVVDVSNMTPAINALLVAVEHLPLWLPDTVLVSSSE